MPPSSLSLHRQFFSPSLSGVPIITGHAAGEFMSSFSEKRARIVLVCVAVLMSTMIVRVAYLQTYGRQKTIQMAERQQHTAIKSMARRGTISSRNGYALAATVQTTALYIDPKFMLKEYQREKRNLNQMDNDLRKMCR